MRFADASSTADILVIVFLLAAAASGLGLFFSKRWGAWGIEVASVLILAETCMTATLLQPGQTGWLLATIGVIGFAILSLIVCIRGLRRAAAQRATVQHAHPPDSARAK